MDLVTVQYELWAWAGIAVFIWMTGWYVLSVIWKRMDIVDVAWGSGFVVVAMVTWLLGSGTTRSGVVVLLVIIWGLRLTSHLAHRLLHQSEDRRYVTFRQAWGRHTWWRSYPQVFLLQGLLMLMISSSVIATVQPGSVWGMRDWLGLGIWVFGFLWEAIGDAQLVTFLRQPGSRGKVMMTGLWKYSRHPNYFGEIVQWWGIWIISLSVAGGLMTVFAPLTITVLILFVSGVPLLERQYRGRLDWESYRRRTSMILPWPPRSVLPMKKNR